MNVYIVVCVLVFLCASFKMMISLFLCLCLQSLGGKFMTPFLLLVGHDVYLVGGCVRDLILKQTPKDFDIITSADLREVTFISYLCFDFQSFDVHGSLLDNSVDKEIRYKQLEGSHVFLDWHLVFVTCAFSIKANFYTISFQPYENLNFYFGLLSSDLNFACWTFTQFVGDENIFMVWDSWSKIPNMSCSYGWYHCWGWCISILLETFYNSLQNYLQWGDCYKISPIKWCVPFISAFHDNSFSLLIRFQVLILLEANWVCASLMILRHLKTVIRRTIFVGGIVWNEILRLTGCAPVLATSKIEFYSIFLFI